MFQSLLWLAFCVVPGLLLDSGFESGLSGWGDLWTRTEDVGHLIIDTEVAHGGNASVRIEHRGDRDWSLGPEGAFSVQPGDVIVMNAWVRVQGEGTTSLCAITRTVTDEIHAWMFAERRAGATDGWRQLHSRFVVPPNVAEIRPRMVGSGPATVWVDDFSVRQEGNIMQIRNSELPDELRLTNDMLTLMLDTQRGTFLVKDHRTGDIWRQAPFAEQMILLDAQQGDGDQIVLRMIHAPSGIDVQVAFQLIADQPELLVELQADGELTQSVLFPEPFITQAGTYLVVPMNEGISYPVEDASIKPMRLIAYGGHGICMPFWGVTNGTQGQMAILETPDDASIRIERVADRLCILPEWESQRGEFGYTRRVRYVFFDQGGHVAICKRYRQHAAEMGLLKTLAQKHAKNPNVDRLIGAVNVWCWDRDGAETCREMQELGIERILWSRRQSPETVRQLNAMGVLSSRYDIYQDVMDPANLVHLWGKHPDWPTEAWPDDLMLDAEGEWRRGWRVRGKDGGWYPCGVLCDRRAPDYARKRIREELETHPYLCRFIDTTTASPWRECYHPDHPMTRTESKQWKMALLRVVSEEMGLVTGSETGHDAAVPYVHYFEGMLSLGPYRVPEAGRDMIRPWTEVPERVAKFQVGYAYRLPLWELVYHDCVVSQWYWGDYNNKLPSLWDRRDLFNILYGTPPMFMFNREIWEAHRQRFVQSYQQVGTIARRVGYAEMVDHRFLTPDRSVQQTSFSDGTTITVNFGDSAFVMLDGSEIAPMSYRVTP